MEFVLEQDKTHKGYPYYIELNDQISRGDQKEFLSRLTSQQTDYLNQYKALLRQRKWLSNADNRKKSNIERNKIIKKLRETEPARMAEQNRVDVRNHRLRNKIKEEEINRKIKENQSKQTLTDAIRARKARAELNKLKTAKESKQNVSDILNDIIAAVPTESKKKKNREAVARHRSKKPQGIPTKVYNTRSRGRTLNL